MRALFPTLALGLFTACAAQEGAEDTGTLSTEMQVGGATLELLVEYDDAFDDEAALDAVRDARPAFERLAAEDPEALADLVRNPPVRLVLTRESAVSRALDAAAWSVDIGKCRYFWDGLSYKGYMCAG